MNDKAPAPAPHVPQIQRIIGQPVTGKHAKIVLEFDFAKNDAEGKALFPLDANALVDLINNAIDSGSGAIRVYGVSINLHAFLTFRAG